MRLHLTKIDHGDGTVDLQVVRGRTLYARTVQATDVDTPAKLGLYLLGELNQDDPVEETYILEAHRDAGDAWGLDSFTSDGDRDGGRNDIRGLPGWADWTDTEAVAWIDQNVTDLASAKTALRAMARLLIYLRDSVL